MRPYSVFDVAYYFRTLIDEDEGDLLSNLKLQKLCYYAQGMSWAVKGEALFSESIEAWDHGPVVPTLYFQFREYGSGFIPALRDYDYSRVARIAPKDQEFLDHVYKFYGQFSAWKLRDMTHGEDPWKNAYQRGINTVITNEVLESFFKGKEKVLTEKYPEYDLDYLLEDLTPDKLQEEIKTGRPVGEEIW